MKGFTLVEIMIVVAILGLLIAMSWPGFLTARNKSFSKTELANLKAINDNIATYGINEQKSVDVIERLWPANSTTADPDSYIRKQLFCPQTKAPYVISTSQKVAQCTRHGTEADIL